MFNDLNNVKINAYGLLTDILFKILSNKFIKLLLK
jgi:hypothetical protein